MDSLETEVSPATHLAPLALIVDWSEEIWALSSLIAGCDWAKLGVQAASNRKDNVPDNIFLLFINSSNSFGLF